MTKTPKSCDNPRKLLKIDVNALKKVALMKQFSNTFLHNFSAFQRFPEILHNVSDQNFFEKNALFSLFVA